MEPTTHAYLHRSGEAELRWMGETSTFFLSDPDDATSRPVLPCDHAAVSAGRAPATRLDRRGADPRSSSGVWDRVRGQLPD